jgi:peptidoglycan/LPS O-acetylase OafA/YrhL
MESTKHRLAYIDALRGFAISGVIVYHCFLWTLDALSGLCPILKQIANQGGNGVQLFFVVSAFTLSLSIESARKRGTFSLATFFRNRCFRIVPLYWLAIVWYLAENRFRGGEPISALQVLAGATFTNGWVPGWMNAPVSGGWSIMMEVYFYFALPFLLLWVKDIRRAAILVLVCLAIQIPILAAFADSPPGSARSLWTAGMGYLIPTKAVVFALGLFLFRLLSRESGFASPALPSSASGQPVPAAFASLSLILSGALLIAFLLANVPLLLPSEFLFAVAYVLIALGLSRRRWSLLCNPVTCAVGKASYSAYLCHFALLDGAMRFLLPSLQGTGWSDTAVFLSFTAAMLFLTAFVSHGFYVALEQPIQRLNRRFFG